MAQKYGIAIDYRRCIGCGSCSVSCKLENNLPNDVWYCTVNTVGGASKDCPGGSYGANTIAYQPLRCQHCENPECVKVCPTEASHVAEDGSIQVDKDKCIGCQFCAMACPYGVRYLNQTERVVEKCTLCEQRTSQGELPQCVAQCGARARFFGDLDQGVENFEAPAHPDTPGCQYDDMTKTRVKLKDYVEAFTENDIHHLTNKGNNPKLMYLLREGRKWRE